MAEVSFGDWLKHRRLGLGLTQGQLALQLNCSTSALRKFESEERRPSGETIDQLADLFHIAPEGRATFVCFARGDWQAAVDGGADPAPWRPPAIDQPSILPSSVTAFIGREKEQREVISLLQKNRLVTLAGAGGMGKTRLAVQVGQLLLRAYPDGIWFVPLDSLSDPLRVPQTVAAVFGIQEGHDRQVMDTLIHVLHEKNGLLILDNCEHLLDACTGLVRTLLTRCPNLRILTTSREILQVEGEATYSLSALSTPRESDPLETISGYDSIQLFVDRAGLILTTFQLTRENAPTIADICRRLNGIPLAIELIVARVNILTVEEILKQLRKSFAILESSRRKTLSRHQTLRASIDWSWSLLSEPEQVFLRQLSIFAGGWTLDSAQAVCAGNALDLIDSLAQKSLIVVEQERERTTRYHFHEFLYQYAHEKLAQSGELETVSARHLRYFLGFSEEVERGLRGSEQELWYQRAMDERDNVIAALEQAALTDIEAGLYLSSRLLHVWERYDIRMGAAWVDAFLQRPESEKYPLARARALCAHGWMLLWLEKFAPAREIAEECLALYRACGDRGGEIDALNLLGTTYYYVGDRAEGNKHYHQALALAQALGDTWRQAKVYYLFSEENGDFRISIDHLKKAEKLFGEMGDRRSQAVALIVMAYRWLYSNEFELAEKCLDQGARLVPLEMHKDIRGDIQVVKSLIAFSRGDIEGAAVLMQTALELYEKLGNQIQCQWINARFGYYALARGDTREARAVFGRSTESFQKSKDNIGVIYSLEGMAAVLVAAGVPDTAARLIGWADAMRKEVNELRPQMEQKDVDRVVAACADRLGEGAFTDAYQEGQGMTLNEAVELALNAQPQLPG